MAEMRRWCIGCFSELKEYDNYETALQGGPLNKMIIRGNQADLFPISQFLLSMEEEPHRQLAAACEKKIAAKMREKNYNFITPPNYDDIKQTTISRQEKVSSGFLGLKKTLVTRQEKVPNPQFAAFEGLLKGEDFISLNSFRAEIDEGVNTEYDDAYLLTESGRFLNLKYEVTYSPSFGTNITGFSEVPQLDIKPNILLAGNICAYLGREAFEAMINA